MTLKDGDFETTISGSRNVQQPKVKAPEAQPAKKADNKNEKAMFDLFDLLFGF